MLVQSELPRPNPEGMGGNFKLSIFQLSRLRVTEVSNFKIRVKEVLHIKENVCILMTPYITYRSYYKLASS